jgi:uncharacterized protein with HEPN domain
MQIKDKILLRKILEEIDVAEEVAGAAEFDAFSSDKVLQHAVVMALLNIGELAKNLDSEIHKKTPEIPWRQIIGLRNIAAHGYASLDMADIWQSVVDDIPTLKSNVLMLLMEPSAESESSR